MDNHPIPQDVTNFQFKLIGDLTLKQFGYLIASVILTWFILLLPVLFILKFPFALLSLGLGVILAFIPLEGRPSDLMLLHFLKALFSPNQYIYVAEYDTRAQVGNQLQQKPKEEVKQEKDEKVFLNSLPISMPQQPTSSPTNAAFVNPTQAPMVEEKQNSAPIQTQPPVSVPQAPEQNITNEEEKLEEELTKAKEEEAHVQEGTAQAQAAHDKVKQLETELHDVFLQKQDLEKQILELKQQLVEKKQQTVFTPSVATAPQETARVLKIPKQLGKSVGLPITPDTPNLLTGIVKDPRGNVLPNILIEVKDKDGNAVRAFKTNTLGQFASATPLLNGTYTVSFEDPGSKQQFDMVEITANGEIIMPIEVISEDQREKLRQELFGAQIQQ